MQPRPPVVTILGHVDHGKTTLLDYIRKSNITTSEHGGITQKIGAYEVSTAISGYPTNKITFIDTPGHEAFSMLRSRGADVADIAILLVDAKDSLKPQTIESIAHIKNAKIPFIVALNKTDLPDANPQKVKNDLMKHEVMTEDKGGTIPSIEISAKTGKGVPELLETILLIAADHNLTYDPSALLKAYIIETKKDKRGIVISAIIKDGTLRRSNVIYATQHKAKVRAIANDIGISVEYAVPSMPVELLGFEQIPEVGTIVSATPSQEDENAIEQTLESQTKTITDINAFLETPKDEKKLQVIIKADSQGSLDAILQTISKHEIIHVVMGIVGNVHRSDVFLAKTTNAIIVGFNIYVDNEVKQLAKQEKVIIKTYRIIYELLDELLEVSHLLKEKEEKEKQVKGEVKILANFIIEGEKIYGITVTKGKINLGDNIEVYRNNNVIGKSRLVSLKIRAKPVDEVRKGQEAGMILGPQLDLHIGDVVQFIL